MKKLRLRAFLVSCPTKHSCTLNSGFLAPDHLQPGLAEGTGLNGDLGSRALECWKVPGSEARSAPAGDRGSNQQCGSIDSGFWLEEAISRTLRPTF